MKIVAERGQDSIIELKEGEQIFVTVGGKEVETKDGVWLSVKDEKLIVSSKNGKAKLEKVA